MTPEEYLSKVLDTTEQAMQRADNAQERMVEKNTPEPNRIQCAHCNGYYDDDEICLKNLCYKCEEDLDDYRRVKNQRNLFLAFIKNIRKIANRATNNIRIIDSHEVIKSMCDGILSQYKEE